MKNKSLRSVGPFPNIRKNKTIKITEKEFRNIIEKIIFENNKELNNLKNVEIYLSDLFSAIPDRTYHQIFTNPPQSLGNEFLKEIITESFYHLKPNGALWLVVKKNVKSFIERVLKEIFLKYEIITSGREHVVIKAIKQ